MPRKQDLAARDRVVACLESAPCSAETLAETACVLLRTLYRILGRLPTAGVDVVKRAGLYTILRQTPTEK